MTQESLSREQREQRAGEELAAQLDALSRPLAERVLGRAIAVDEQLRSEAEAAAETLDYDMLRRVASEVGISETALQKALMEELNTDRDHNARPLERATIPDAVRGGLIVPGLADDVAERLRDYLEQVEGLERRREKGMVSEWAPRDRRRGRPAQSWTIRQGREDRQLVEINVETGSARKTFFRWLVAIAILGVLFGSPIGGFIVLGIWIAGMVTLVGWLRRLGRKARRTVNRALSTLSGGESDPTSWLEVWERSRTGR